MNSGRQRIWPTYFGLSALAVYIVWNACWLMAERIPPSIFTGVTGFPCPTTGGTRSFLALLNGDFAKSFYFNPMLVPVVGLLLLTVWQAIYRGKAQNWIAPAWVLVLAIAWIGKFLSPVETW